MPKKSSGPGQTNSTPSKRQQSTSRTKPGKLRRPRARRLVKDEFGTPLTSNEPYFSLLPSDLMPAFAPPPGTPREGMGKADPKMPTTTIPELRAIEFTEFAYHCVVEAIQAADNLQIARLNPTGGANLRYRIEIAAAFLAHVMDHSYSAATAIGDRKPEEFVSLGVNLVVRRAEEIYGQSGA